MSAKREIKLTLSILYHDPPSLAGMIIIGAFFLIVLVSYFDLSLLTPYNPDALNFPARNLPPSLAHLFGTDFEGRDVFARSMAALPLDIFIPFVIVGVGVGIGFTLGLIAGYFGGWIEEITLRVTDLFLAFPVVILALTIAAVLGQGDINLRIYYSMLALIVVSWPFYTRIARAQVLQVRSLPYVTAAKTSGISSFRIIRRHILPQVSPVVIAYATLDMGAVIITYSVFAFFGLGAVPPTPELGQMVYDGLSALPGNWWWSVFPGIILALLALGFSLIGEGLRDAFDPRLRAQRTVVPLSE